MAKRGLPIQDRIAAAVVVDANGCWRWQRYIHRTGYGRITIRSGGEMQIRLAHRVSYTAFKGEIPEGLQLDHLCRVRDCVNPDHLEPVTSAENTRRGDLYVGGVHRQTTKTHCPHGHPYNALNTHVDKLGFRSCRTCRRISNRASSLRRVAARRAAA